MFWRLISLPRSMVTLRLLIRFLSPFARERFSVSSARMGRAKQLGAVFLIAVTSTLLGLFIAVSVKEIFEAQTFSNFFRFPMIFLCGLFIPLQTLPLFLRPLSYILPLTYGADILKSSINQNGQLGLLVNFTILLGFSVALFALSMRNVKRKWIY